MLLSVDKRWRCIGASIADAERGAALSAGFSADYCPGCAILRQELAAIQAEVNRLVERGNEALRIAQQWEARARLAEDYPDLVKHKPRGARSEP